MAVVRVAARLGETMTDAQRIARLEHVVGTLVSWLVGGGLSVDEAKELHAMLTSERSHLVKEP